MTGNVARSHQKYRLLCIDVKVNDILYVLLALCSIVWVLAVVKVFVYEGGKVDSLQHTLSSVATTETDTIKEKVVYVRPADNDYPEPDTSGEEHIHLPRASDWLFLRSGQVNLLPIIPPIIEEDKKAVESIAKEDVVIESKVHEINFKSSVTSNTNHLQMKASGLSWPPVSPDGTIPDADGFDTLPIIGIKVPRFWEAPEGSVINEIGSKVNGFETIFLMIASYRDFQCRETITSAFNSIDHPERLFIGAVDQVVPGDIGCLDIEVPCSQDPDQPICKYRSQIAVFKMDAQYAAGPVTARHIGDRLYRGQYFVAQLDAHCFFVKHWDTFIINQWKQTKNEMAVLRFVKYD